jgi:hypothetical protein
VACVAIVLLVASLVEIFRTSQPVSSAKVSPSSAPTPSGPSVAKQNETPTAVTESGQDAQSGTIDDDGKTLWVSPTHGKPLDLSYLAPGAQIIVAIRAGALAAHSESEKTLAAVGPTGERAAEFLKSALNDLPRFDRIVIGFQPLSSGQWQSTLVAHLSSGTAAHFVNDQFPQAIEKKIGNQSYWLSGDRAYFAPQTADGKTLVVAPPDAITDIIDLAGQPPPLRRDIEQLLTHTDGDRDVTVVLAPNSLFSEGRSMFEGELSRLRDPLNWFLGDELSAAALSLHWSDNFFVELVATPTLDTLPEKTARILKERVDLAADKLEEYVVSLNPNAYGRHVVARFPAMFRKLASYTRSGFERDHAVLRCYLPVVAGHNLLMGAELILAETPGTSAPITKATPTASVSDSPLFTVDERLKKVTSLKFARDTLEAALEQLSQDIGVPIVIRGPDLQADGITKNQSFGIDLENKPAGEILVEILRLANPDKTATGPEDTRQKLVYVIVPAAPGGEQIAITTRAKAKERRDELPAVFTEKTP